MASSDDIKKEGAKASLEKLQDGANKLKAAQVAQSTGTVFNLSDAPKKAKALDTETSTQASTPNPALPMDHSVLESIGLSSKGSSLSSSSVSSGGALSDARKNASQESLLPKQKEQSLQKESAAIQVDSGYKPSFQSQDRAKLVASMDKPQGSADNAAGSLQSRLQGEQGNLYRSVTEKPAQNNQPLGGGFRMANDPNISSKDSASSGSYASIGTTQVEDSGIDGPNAEQLNQAESGAQTVHHHEEVKGKSGIGAGAMGALGLLLVAGGGAAVIMKPELLSTTGGLSGSTGAVQTVSALGALIPEASEVYQKPAPIAQVPAPALMPAPIQNQKVAAVAVMPVPAQPARQAAPAAPVNTTDRFSETGKDVALNLDVTPLKVKSDQYIRIGGMPDDATLSSGVDMGDGNWLVAPDAIKTISLSTADGYKGTLDLYMQKIKDDAQTAVGTPKTFKVVVGEKPKQVIAAAPQKELRVTSYNPIMAQPTRAAPPQAAPEPIRKTRQMPALPTGVSEENDGEGFGALPTANRNKYQRPTARKRAVAPIRAPRNLREALPVGRTFSKKNYGDTVKPIQQQRIASASAARSIPQVSPQRAKILLKRGNNLYRLGDLISARALYGQIAAGGNAEAAMAMGRTYDPIYFEKLGVQGFQAEPNRALDWYKKAKNAGLSKAQTKIDNLNYYLNQ